MNIPNIPHQAPARSALASAPDAAPLVPGGRVGRQPRHAVGRVTGAQVEAYRVADRLRAAAWHVQITISDAVNAPDIPVRTVTVRARRGSDDPYLAVSWATTLTGSFRTRRVPGGYWCRADAQASKVRITRADQVEAFVRQALERPRRRGAAEDQAGAPAGDTADGPCIECGTFMSWHADGCRYAARCAEQVPAPGAEVYPVGWWVVRAGTPDHPAEAAAARLVPGVYACPDEAARWADGHSAAEVRPAS